MENFQEYLEDGASYDFWQAVINYIRKSGYSYNDTYLSTAFLLLKSQPFHHTITNSDWV
jgi:hypothetical protein